PGAEQLPRHAMHPGPRNRSDVVSAAVVSDLPRNLRAGGRAGRVNAPGGERPGRWHPPPAWCLRARPWESGYPHTNRPARREHDMAQVGWQRLLAGAPWFRGEGSYPIAAYSEFMPPPRVGRKPYEADGAATYNEADPWGWPVTEAEDLLEL